MGNKEYWDKNLKAYRLKKRIRALTEKMGLVGLAKRLGVSKQYINNWSKEYLPDDSFIQRLKELEND